MDDIYIEDEKTKYLDLILKDARNLKHSPIASIIGLTGSEKTSHILSWIKHNNLKCLHIPTYALRVFKTRIKYSPIDELSKVSKHEIKSVSNKELKDLFDDKENDDNVLFTSAQIDSMNQDTVLIFDNYDVASQDVRDELYKLFKDLIVIDPRAIGKDKIKKVNPLMSIVINESSNIILKKPLSDKELDLLSLNDYKNK